MQNRVYVIYMVSAVILRQFSPKVLHSLMAARVKEHSKLSLLQEALVEWSLSADALCDITSGCAEVCIHISFHLIL